MALNATIYRFGIQLSDMDRHVYQNLSVHVALHPSETMQRMAIRLCAYCLNYDEHLQFTKGLSTDTEPDLWRRNYSDEIESWIEVGLPDSKRLKKACNQAQEVLVYAYGGQGLDTWWQCVRKDLRQQKVLKAYQVDLEPIEYFANAITRTMSLSCVIQDGQINLSWDQEMIDIEFSALEL